MSVFLLELKLTFKWNTIICGSSNLNQVTWPCKPSLRPTITLQVCNELMLWVGVCECSTKREQILTCWLDRLEFRPPFSVTILARHFDRFTVFFTRVFLDIRRKERCNSLDQLGWWWPQDKLREPYF